MHPPAASALAPLTAATRFPDEDTDASGPPLDVVANALHDAFDVRANCSWTEKLSHLDTADWRLLRIGIDVASVAGTGALMALRSDGSVIEQPVGSASWPALVTAIADGSVRDTIGGAVGVRALIPFATTHSNVTSIAVVNDDDKTVARIQWRDVSVRHPLEHRLPRSVTVEALRGYGAEAAEVHRLLVERAGMSPADGTWLTPLRTLPWTGPDATKRCAMPKDEPADLAVAAALLGYLSVLESTVGGVISDIDTEFLHDFRVAVRRTRSVLKLLGEVLPAGVADRVEAEFRWLGDVTTPTRDLDVYLLSIDGIAQSLTRPGDLDAFAQHLASRRKSERRKLTRTLRSKRFLDLCSSWRTELEEVMAAATHQTQTAAQLADRQLHRTYRKVTKRAGAISSDSPAEDFHSLRKTCKEMRYVLDVFRPLLEPAATKKVVADFKALQDVLGEFQDGEVQATALRAFAQEMLDDGRVDVSAMLAMGELSARFETQQRAARTTLLEHHDRYLGPRSAAHVDRLVKA